MIPATLLSALFHLASVSALVIPFERRSSSSSSAAANAVEFTAQPISQSAGSFDFGEIDVDGDAQNIYVGNVTINGQQFEVQLDTGSSDLWVSTSTALPSSTYPSSGVTGSITYGDGTSATGPILVGEVSFGNFKVPQQAFIAAPKTNAVSDGDRGLLGLGPPGISVVNSTLSAVGKTSGSPFLINVFSQNASMPPIVGMQLTRNELGKTSGGVFSIGEIDAAYKQVLSTPLMTSPLPSELALLMTGVEINGELVTGNQVQPGSLIPHGIITNDTAVLLDSGTALGQAPQVYVDKMYSALPGAVFNPSAGTYQVPCNSHLNVSFVFGNQSFPIDPLDAVYVGGVQGGKAVCFGTFQAITEKNFNGFDFILGDSFLRNVFAVFNYTNKITPGMQLLSTVNMTQANADFSAAVGARQNASVAAFEAQKNGQGALRATGGGVVFFLAALSSAWVLL